MNDWRDYQEQVAQLFRDLACTVEVEAKIQGVRAIHEVDVWVVFKRFGIETKWVIECKRWKSAVPKEKVAALKWIVDDLGADRGLLVAESFQSGAFDASTLTNITLTTLEQLRENVILDFYRISVEQIERKIDDLTSRMLDFYVTKSRGPKYFSHSPRPGVVTDIYLRLLGELSLFERGLKGVRLNQYPCIVGFDENQQKVIFADNIGDFIGKSSQFLEEMELWVIQTEEAIGKMRPPIESRRN